MIAVIITIMVLEMKVPHGEDAAALVPLIPVFLSYVLSFVFIGLYWNNHHHMFHCVRHVNGATLWANNHFAALPVAAYGGVLLGAGIAYFILTRALLRIHDKDSTLAKGLGRDFKGKISVVIYLAAIPLAFVHPWIAGALYVVVAALWLCPDPRFEKLLAEQR